MMMMMIHHVNSIALGSPARHGGIMIKRLVVSYDGIDWCCGRHSSENVRSKNLRPHLIRRRHLTMYSTGRVDDGSGSTRTNLYSDREEIDDTATSGPTLDWEKFEFSATPKWDSRFRNSRTIEAATAEELEQIRMVESKHDEEVAHRWNLQQKAWEQLKPAVVHRATQVLLPYVKPERVDRIAAVLQQRTCHTSFLFENPSNPSNVWACLRTIDAFGIQHVNVVIQSAQYRGKAAISQKRGMKTAMGSARWLTIHNHLSTTEAIRYLRQAENRWILASDLSPTSKDIRDIDWERISDRPVCIVMGNEERGISDEMRSLVDETFTLPMYGFAESFNLSVATAITLAHLSAASKQASGKGPLRPGDLTEPEYNYLFLRGILNSIAQRRVAMALLRQNEIDLPLDNGWF